MNKGHSVRFQTRQSANGTRRRCHQAECARTRGWQQRGHRGDEPLVADLALGSKNSGPKSLRLGTPITLIRFSTTFTIRSIVIRPCLGLVFFLVQRIHLRLRRSLRLVKGPVLFKIPPDLGSMRINNSNPIIKTVSKGVLCQWWFNGRGLTTVQANSHSSPQLFADHCRSYVPVLEILDCFLVRLERYLAIEMFVRFTLPLIVLVIHNLEILEVSNRVARTLPCESQLT